MPTCSVLVTPSRINPLPFLGFCSPALRGLNRPGQGAFFFCPMKFGDGKCSHFLPTANFHLPNGFGSHHTQLKVPGLNGGVCGTEQVEDAARQSFFFFFSPSDKSCLSRN